MIDSDDLTPDYQLEATEGLTEEDKQGRVVNGKIVPGKRKFVEIDRETVIKLAKLHCTMADIGRWFNVDDQIIKVRFGEDIKLAQSETKAKLRRTMLQKALSGDTTMLIWLSKNMLGFGDNGPIDSDDKKPLPFKDD